MFEKGVKAIWAFNRHLARHIYGGFKVLFVPTESNGGARDLVLFGVG